ncbi:MAG: sialate O-acetylesterase [Verrucomicrobiota bacterium]|nr:sialate O-acetylesterase [Verrucomicrobiota bacterium]
MTKRFLFSPSILIVIFSAFFVQAETKIPSILGSHMVLQQGEKCPVWGWDEAGTGVTVSFAGQTHTTKAGKDGRWRVSLNAMKANAKGAALTIKGSSTVKLEDVLVGEVWLCSGQSNMEWTVSRSSNPKEEIANGNHPLIRHIKIPHRPSAKPESNVPSTGWQPCTPKVVANFTAVGYYFGRHLHEKLNVPIGLIGSNWGGTRIEPWIPPVGFKSVPALKANFADKLDQFPSPTRGNGVNHQSPLALYNGMISPLLPYTIKGALWYQGESNNGEGMLYHEKMKALIAGWRSVWNNPELPFYYVQLAPFRYGSDNDPRLPGIWQAQLETLKVPHTGMAVTTDITTLRNIHPPNKQDVGKRLALWALTKDYGKKLKGQYTGPIFSKMDHAEGKESLTVHFQKDSTGGLTTNDKKPVSHFEIAGKDGKWHPAKATIVYGDHLIVKSDAVKNPVHVRFGWHQMAEPNLVNGAGLPASPFSTAFK